MPELLECIQKFPYANGRAQHDCFHGSANMFALRATEFVLVLNTLCTYHSHIVSYSGLCRHHVSLRGLMDKAPAS